MQCTYCGSTAHTTPNCPLRKPSAATAQLLTTAARLHDELLESVKRAITYRHQVRNPQAEFSRNTDENTTRDMGRPR
jgi:hypothetical protein